MKCLQFALCEAGIRAGIISALTVVRLKRLSLQFEAALRLHCAIKI